MQVGRVGKKGSHLALGGTDVGLGPVRSAGLPCESGTLREFLAGPNRRLSSLGKKISLGGVG